jgi:RNA ligase
MLNTDTIKLMDAMLEQGYLIKRKHDKLPLWIYNYSQTCQFESVWNEATLMCRGLVLDESYNVIAKPFPKFFNWEELIRMGWDIPKGKFTYSDKMDGSLGILFNYEGETHIASRGSFHSEQAKEANLILNEKYSHIKFDKNITYLFEIIYPSNRIVVNYGEKRDLVLLGMIETSTGKDIDISDAPEGLEITKQHEKPVSFQSLKDLNTSNDEGFVIKFENGFRMKIKFEEYCALHRIVTNYNEKTVWEMLKNEDEVNFEIDLPEEFLEWYEKTKKSFQEAYCKIENEALRVFNLIDPCTNRKNNAITIMKENSKVAGIVFNIMDGKDYTSIIWQKLKPKTEVKK